MKRTFYEKRGRRYFPVREYDDALMNSMPTGSHLLVIQPGMQSVLYNVCPDHVRVLAALKKHEQAMCAAVREGSKLRPQELTPKERKAIKAYYDIMGPEALFTMSAPSAMDVVRALEKELIATIEADELAKELK